jgi:hypothetical protein
MVLGVILLVLVLWTSGKIDSLYLVLVPARVRDRHPELDLYPPRDRELRATKRVAHQELARNHL